ncbi:MAG: SRPBCC family protein [Myxococcota bacterium]
MNVPLPRVYGYLWDVAAQARCIPGLDRCEPLGDDTFRFVYAKRQYGPVSMAPRYTTRFEGNGTDRIFARATGAADDNTLGSGTLRLQAKGESATRIVMHQKIIPDTPVPRLAQGLIRSFVEREATEAVDLYLTNVKRALEQS